MTLINLLVVLIVTGVLLYIVQILLPIDGRIKQVINIIVFLFVLIYILQAFGLLSGPHVRLR